MHRTFSLSTSLNSFGSIMEGRSYEGDTSLGYRFGFNGKEKDGETYGVGNEIDFGSRIYNSRLGRWLSLDPLQSKYPELSPHNYCANNPVLFIDPDGKKIVVPNVEDRAAVLKMIHSKAKGKFAFNDNGELILVKSRGRKGSEYYRDQLIAGINDNETATIRIGPVIFPTKNNPKDGKIVEYKYEQPLEVDDQGGGVTSGKAGLDQLTVISGNGSEVAKDTEGNTLKQTAADILMHELLGHAIPGITKPDSGNAVDNENKAREQLRKRDKKVKIRVAEPDHKEE